MIRRNEEIQAQIGERNVQAQAERQAQQENMKAQQQLILEKAKAIAQKDIDNNEAKNQAKLEQLKANLKYKENLQTTKRELLNARFKQQSEQQPATVGD